MPKRDRRDEAGAIQHVYAHAVANELLFVDAEDCELYLRLLARTVADCHWICLSYCLMGNHVHLLVETQEANLSEGMQWLHWRYAVEFNQRHGKRGHCFDRPFGSTRVQSQEQFEAVARYIPLNPVAAGFCGMPDDWTWGSYRGLVTGDEPAWMGGARLLWFLGSLDRYRRLVAGA